MTDFIRIDNWDKNGNPLTRNPIYNTVYSDKTIEEINEGDAVLQLLRDGHLFVLPTSLERGSWEKEGPTHRILGLAVNTSDTFAWGCADMEWISESELLDFYKLCKSVPIYGSTIWACKKNNLQPQQALKEKMIEAGVWNEELEKLPENK